MVKYFWQRDTTLHREMQQTVGEMKHFIGEMQQTVGEMKHFLGKRSKFDGEMKQMDGEMKQNVLGRCPNGKVQRHP